MWPNSCSPVCSTQGEAVGVDLALRTQLLSTETNKSVFCDSFFSTKNFKYYNSALRTDLVLPKDLNELGERLIVHTATYATFILRWFFAQNKCFHNGGKG